MRNRRPPVGGVGLIGRRGLVDACYVLLAHARPGSYFRRQQGIGTNTANR